MHRRWKRLQQNHSELFDQIAAAGVLDNLLDELGDQQGDDDDMMIEENVVSLYGVWLEKV